MILPTFTTFAPHHKLLSMRLLLFLLFISAAYPLAAQQALDFSKNFKNVGVRGSFSLFDLNKKEYSTTDRKEFKLATSPASTFKIPNSLIALEEKVIEDENQVLPWDKQIRSVAAWNEDTDLRKAYKNSVVWFYQELARRIGEENYVRYLKKLQYGNEDISGGLTQFWLGSSLKISPEEQLQFLRQLHQENLPFSKRTYEKVKNMMIEEKTEQYTLRAKTGWASTSKEDIGWFVGYVEKHNNVYFFATRIYKPADQEMENFADLRRTLTRQILTKLGIL